MGFERRLGGERGFVAARWKKSDRRLTQKSPVCKATEAVPAAAMWTVITSTALRVALMVILTPFLIIASLMVPKIFRETSRPTALITSHTAGLEPTVSAKCLVVLEQL